MGPSGPHPQRARTAVGQPDANRRNHRAARLLKAVCVERTCGCGQKRHATCEVLIAWDVDGGEKEEGKKSWLSA